MRQFNKAIVYLEGTSSAIQFLPQVRSTIFECLRALNIPFEEYKNPMNGFPALTEDFNKPDTLYIVADSLQFHLCTKSPVIVICRSGQVYQSTPGQNCIGVLTQEMVFRDWNELAACIYRNQPQRPHFDNKAARNYLLYSEHTPKDADSFYRYAFAAHSWGKIATQDPYTILSGYQSDKLPRVNEMLKEAVEGCTHPDDIIILINRDIALIPEAIGIIRTFLETRNIEHCFAHRVDIQKHVHQSFVSLWGKPYNVGVDLFAIRPSSPAVPILTSTPLYIGRTAWDHAWTSQIKNRLPFNVAYHIDHIGEWKSDSPEIQRQNKENEQALWDMMPHVKSYSESGYEGVGPLS